MYPDSVLYLSVLIGLSQYPYNRNEGGGVYTSLCLLSISKMAMAFLRLY